MPKESSLIIREDNLDEHYIIGEKIGDGHFAEVKLATCRKTNKLFAAKFIVRKRQKLFGYVDPSAAGMTLNDIEREANILAQLDNENIIKLYEVFHHKDSVVLIIELVTGGELFARVAECERLSEEEASNFITQILYGVDHIHSQGIVHLDLKPENIMIEDLASRKIKLIDFGLARTLHPNQSFQDMAGTPEFCAPEIVNFDPITAATDMWAIGVITYILLTGISPFAGDSQLETFQNILDCYVDFDRPEMNGVTELAKDFIRSLLVKSPSKRANAKDCLQHPWIRPRDQKQATCRRSSTIIRDKLSHLRNFVVTSSSPGSPPLSPTNKSLSSPDSDQASPHPLPVNSLNEVCGDEENYFFRSENSVASPECTESQTNGVLSSLASSEVEDILCSEEAEPPSPPERVQEITVISTVPTMVISDQSSRKIGKIKSKAPPVPSEKIEEMPLETVPETPNGNNNKTPVQQTSPSGGWRFSIREKLGAAFSAFSSSGSQSPGGVPAKTEEETSPKSSEAASETDMYSLPMSALSLMSNSLEESPKTSSMDLVVPPAEPKPQHRASLAGGGIVKAVAEQRNRAMSVTNGNGQFQTGYVKHLSSDNSNVTRIQRQFLDKQEATGKKPVGEKVAVLTTVNQQSSRNQAAKGIPITVLPKVESSRTTTTATESTGSGKKFWRF